MLDRDAVLQICGQLPHAVEDYPFGDDVAAFKVGGKASLTKKVRAELGLTS